MAKITQMEHRPLMDSGSFLHHSRAEASSRSVGTMNSNGFITSPSLEQIRTFDFYIFPLNPSPARLEHAQIEMQAAVVVHADAAQIKSPNLLGEIVDFLHSFVGNLDVDGAPLHMGGLGHA